MDVRRLEAFCKVYELKSFSKAGQDLLLSQPTISAHVSALESELKTQLFDRLGRSIVATQAGDILYRHAREAFASLENARVEIEALQERVAGDLIIGASTIPAHYVLPKLLSRFSMLYPDVRVRLTVGDSAAIIERVYRGDIAIGVVGAVSEHSELVYTPLATDDLIVCGSPRLLAMRGVTGVKPSLGTKEICTWPWVMREMGSGTRKAFETALLTMGLDLRCMSIAVTVESTEAVLRCVAAGLGLSVVSRLAATDFLTRGEVVIVDAPKLRMHREFYALHHSKRHLFPAQRHFVDFLSETTIGS